MTKIIEKDNYGGYNITEDNSILNAVLASLARSNTFCPNIERIVYNLGKTRNEKSHRNDYILATTVFFVDNTKVTVKNSLKDKVSVFTKSVKLSDGSTVDVETATDESKEVGLMYAIVKRVASNADEHGTFGKGFCTFLKNSIKKSYDQNVEEVKAAKEKNIKKATAKTNTPSKKSQKNPPLWKVVRDLADVVSKLKK